MRSVCVLCNVGCKKLKSCVSAKKKKKKKRKKNKTGQKLNRLLSPDIFENEFPPFICTKKKYWFPPFICTKAAGYLGGKFGD